MSKIKTAALAAIIALAPAAVMAQAQSLVPGAQDPADAAIDFNTTPDISVTGMRDSDFTTSLSILSSPTSVSIVQVGNNAQFEAPDIQGLQDAVLASPQAMSSLQAAGLSAANVVGIEAAGDGAVTLYVNV